MPAPAVYVLAVVGTVGAVLAFKEFVYEPHIAPRIDRWMIEFQAARRRRNEVAMCGSEGDLLMSQTESRRPSRGKFSEVDDHSSDDETPFGDHGNGSSASSNQYMRNGLLLKRPERDAQHLQNQRDVEMDDLASSEVSEWRTGQTLRQRKQGSEHAMDESIQPIPYSPLSPSRTHVLFDSSSPSTPSSGSRPTSPRPPPPQSPPLYQPHHLSFNMTSGANKAGDSASPSPVPRSPEERKDQIQKLTSSTQLNQTMSPPSQVSPFQQVVSQSTLFDSGPETTPTVDVLRTARDTTSESTLGLIHHPLQQSFTQSVPSLSQSYPQELDYEHGLELLSPPSSRSISPFSMANLSPNPVTAQGLRILSPFGSASSVSSVSRSASNFSSAVSSPSPLRMGLGNESFDTLSPVVQPAQLVQAVSPFLDPPSLSVTNSARSTTYLSFADDSSDDGDRVSQTRPSANVGAGTGLTFGASSPSYPSQRQTQPAPMYSSPPHGSSSGSNSLLLLNNSQAGRAISTSQTPTQASVLASRTPPRQLDGLGLTLFPVPPRAPRTPPTVAAPVNLFAELSADATHAPAPSDGDLSDLDLMSDYAPSESDLGNESDSSWSVAGGSNADGSDAGSPRLRAGANTTAAATPSRSGTVRGRFGWN